jgi:hypothetical protein
MLDAGSILDRNGCDLRDKVDFVSKKKKTEEGFVELSSDNYDLLIKKGGGREGKKQSKYCSHIFYVVFGVK